MNGAIEYRNEQIINKKAIVITIILTASSGHGHAAVGVGQGHQVVCVMQTTGTTRQLSWAVRWGATAASVVVLTTTALHGMVAAYNN